MRFFPHAVKQPLLGTESKRERREKEEDRKFKQWSKKARSLFTLVSKLFLLQANGKFLLVDNFNLAERET